MDINFNLPCVCFSGASRPGPDLVDLRQGILVQFDLERTQGAGQLLDRAQTDEYWCGSARSVFAKALSAK
jgi:hypothetical protein